MLAGTSRLASRFARPHTFQQTRFVTMGVTKKMISPGNGVDKAKTGDTITMEYTGNLQDTNAPDGKGKQFDSSVGRGDFQTRIGVGQVIKGKRCLDPGSLVTGNLLTGL